ncbi:hypothetical protein TIFTF001_037433 [Ficus carica]|uniref:Uncharacterized protein n=1 Tax=Ficus carica TaxID=3494 RepID=A0AA88E9Q5_FICCA|nr:hypothetical protein TIFTF001_037415 [Ficus carica]GMN68361.1 hypothetical protein TIFTF001_037419 [Ficus carica]GMN68370.1 hypothetical protein TIFTF001_037429 [Ficus carica]GMN68375.1 hypothetical protein TIFTF001_037433 [Ficus carica]
MGGRVNPVGGDSHRKKPTDDMFKGKSAFTTVLKMLQPGLRAWLPLLDKGSQLTALKHTAKQELMRLQNA